jgi:hypothetical protein
LVEPTADPQSRRERKLAAAVVVPAILVTIAICWHWDIALLGGKYGLHGGWGFPIFCAVYIALYFPAAFIAKRRT